MYVEWLGLSDKHRLPRLLSGQEAGEATPLRQAGFLCLCALSLLALKEVIRLGQATQGGFWAMTNQKAQQKEAEAARKQDIKREVKRQLDEERKRRR